MYNFYNHISSSSKIFRRLVCGESLLVVFNCGENNKFQDLWSHHNYILYVAKGRKIWHTAYGAYDLREGSFAFVRKGACIIEQFFDTDFCFFLFFVTDDFICTCLKNKITTRLHTQMKFKPVIELENNKQVKIFYESMMEYFNDPIPPDQQLLELKFRELLLILANSSSNVDILSYFCFLMNAPAHLSLQIIMEDNFCFNLKMEEFAKLCSRSLSTFKRDFRDLYKTSPGKWLLEKRLEYANYLLLHSEKNISEIAFESGFENLSHFSRSFKNRYGKSPSSISQSEFGLLSKT